MNAGHQIVRILGGPTHSHLFNQLGHFGHVLSYSLLPEMEEAKSGRRDVKECRQLRDL